VEFQIHFLGPTAFVAAWTLWRRISDCMPNPVPRWEMAMLCLTFVSPFAAFAETRLFELLEALNFVAYAVLFFKYSGARQKLLRELMLASTAMLMLGLPEDLGRIVLPAFARTHAVILALATLVCISALRWFRVRLGLAGACAAAVIVVTLRPGAPIDAYVQTAVLFLLAHSLGWRNQTACASLLRGLAGGIWLADAALWVHHARWQTDAMIASVAVAFLATWFLVWFGFAVAWTRHRWEPTSSTRS
jgi:hypothetical protein